MHCQILMGDKYFILIFPYRLKSCIIIVNIIINFMQTKSILKWALVLSIVIVMNLFFNFAIATVYDAPEYEDFCGQNKEQVIVNPQNQTQCVEGGGQWTVNTEKPQINPSGETIPSGWCDVDFTCRTEWEKARELYDRNVFVALVLLGLAALGVGMFVTSTGSAVSLGLSLGGVLSFVVASVRYWSAMDDYLRVVILGLALVALIIVGVKKFKD